MNPISLYEIEILMSEYRAHLEEEGEQAVSLREFKEARDAR